MSGELTYREATAALSAMLRFGTNPSLESVRALCAALGDPQDAYRCIRVAGTNGKTSVTRMTAALISAHGVRAAAYTSPHLNEYRERIELGGEPVPEADFARAVSAALAADARGEATEFEAVTAAALWLLREAGTAWAVLEVGMGGRWDATGVVSAEVAVVTGVSLDHTAVLGGTVEEIAAEKAQVIVPGCVAVLGPGTAVARAVFEERVAETGVPVLHVTEGGDVDWTVLARPRSPAGCTRFAVRTPGGAYDELALDAPAYQAPNAAVAITAAEAALGAALDPVAVRSALAGMRFPGRFEVLADAPPLVVDGAHNPGAASTLASAVADAWPRAKPVVLLGVLSDKDAEGIVRAIAPVAGGWVCTRTSSPRALSADELAEVVERVTGERPPAHDDLREALAAARDAGGDAGVLATGSLTVAAEVAALMTAG